MKNKIREKSPTKFEVTVLQTWLGEDSTQAQSQLAEILNMIQKSISECCHTIGKILKEDKWMPRDLT